MEEFTLSKKPTKVLKVNIEDETFSIPLAGSLTPEEAAPLDTPAGTVAFIQKYLSKSAIKKLTIDDYNEITAAWTTASGKGGKTPGE